MGTTAVRAVLAAAMLGVGLADGSAALVAAGLLMLVLAVMSRQMRVRAPAPAGNSSAPHTQTPA